MRHILFRGKTLDNGEWVYGSLFGKRHIAVEIREGEEPVSSFGVATYRWVEVIPETVGQYTGLDDKNGVKVFEGDVLVYNGDEFLIFWDKERSGFYLNYWQYDEQYDFSEFWPTSEVIDNIHDNAAYIEDWKTRQGRRSWTSWTKTATCR